MKTRAAGRILPIALCVTALLLGTRCGGSPAAPAPASLQETFTGILQPLSADFRTFTITAQGTSDLSVIVSSLKTVAASTPVTGITIGVGFGTISGGICALQVQNSAAVLGQELFAPSGASTGTYCVQVFDCPPGATGCTSNLTEAVTYTMTVKHF
jgi:hypothetical protein